MVYICKKEGGAKQIPSGYPSWDVMFTCKKCHIQTYTYMHAHTTSPLHRLLCLHRGIKKEMQTPIHSHCHAVIIEQVNGTSPRLPCLQELTRQKFTVTCLKQGPNYLHKNVWEVRLFNKAKPHANDTIFVYATAWSCFWLLLYYRFLAILLFSFLSIWGEFFLRVSLVLMKGLVRPPWVSSTPHSWLFSL